MKRIVHPATPQADVDKFWQRRFNITKFLFAQQLAFVDDPAPFKVAVCSRRSGKTVACAAHLVDVAINNPDVMCLYITLSMRNAERIVWKDLKKINEDHKLGGTANASSLVMTFPNKSTIHLCGANNVTEIENFRGVPLKLVYIDECQSFREYIKELIDDIIGPALMDYAGSLCLIGTPGAVPAGFFHECVQSDVWSKHAWTFFDNPFIAIKSGKTHQQLLDRELKRRGVTTEDPTIQREWFGKWILDSDSLLVRYEADKNHFIQLPHAHKKYTYIMGVDIGFKDADAIAVLGWCDLDPNTYLVEECITPKQGITELVQQIQAFQKKYEISKIVMDMGGLGLKIGEEIIRRHGIPVEAAEKARKMENVALLNDAMRTGRFMAKSASRFAQDSYIVEIDRNKSRPDKIVVSDRYHSDIIDAVLYAFKLSPAYSWESPIEKPKPGTKEWADAQQSSMFTSAMEHFEAEAARDRWLKGES